MPARLDHSNSRGCLETHLKDDAMPDSQSAEWEGGSPSRWEQPHLQSEGQARHGQGIACTCLCPQTTRSSLDAFMELIQLW